MAHELEVWLFADRVGTLALVDGRLNFSYAPHWLEQSDAVALSASLPLQAEPFDDHKARPFFAGLLPEGQMRRLIAQQFQVSGQNDFATTLRCWTTSVANVPEPSPSWSPGRLCLCQPATMTFNGWATRRSSPSWMNCRAAPCWRAKMA